MIHHRTTPKGFTLIELIVALGIFSIVMTIAAASYLSVVAATQNVRESTKALDSLATALTEISNEIRDGSCVVGSSQCGGLGSSSNSISTNSFSFTNVDGNTITYCLTPVGLSGNVVQRVTGSSCSGGTAENITDPSSVNVTNLIFIITSFSKSSGSATATQYWIQIFLAGKPVSSGSSAQTVYLQTGATFRQLTAS
ncbi:MAG: hypothetical protein B7X04_01725 [Parcubacteria group bacterium 21-54-25]|nr:MAG: hypothetical protein B7X04_01725 [Parcubacteria group bacterium 21-54-25]HQU07705.1 prepilin-type N-terminal cleavage/methylation domain-containing protein [Candidatus Paceibacterota bacterium]